MLLDEVNPDSPAQAEAYNLFKKDRVAYEKAVRKIVKDKEAGETIKAPPAPKAPGPPPDIMEALKASLDKVRAG